jgi:NitT/TauT family transport system permease protein
MPDLRKNYIHLLLVALPAVVFFALWFYFSADARMRFLLSSPQQVWQSLCHLVLSGELIKHWGITLVEALAGFIAGNVIGSCLGLLLWHSRIAARIAKPYINAAASIPIFALAPLLIMWFGIGLLSKVALAFLSTVIVALVQSYKGATSVEDRYLKFLRVVGASRMQIFTTVVVPSSLTWVVNGFKLNVGLALLGAFMGEFISSEAGLGYMIVKASGLYDMASVFVGIAALMITAVALTAVVEWIERHLLQWQFQ